MRIIDKYIIKPVISGYLFLVLGFICLYIVIDTSTNLEDILSQQVPVNILFKYYLYFLPQIFVQVSPLSLLVASLYCIGTRNKNNEILSLRTQGMNIFGISKGFLIIAFVVSSFSLFVSDKVVPYTIAGLDKVKSYKEEKIEKAQEIEDFAFYTDKGMIIFAGRFQPQQRLLEEINIFVHDSRGEITREIFADNLSYEDGQWIMKDAYIYDVSGKGLDLDNALYVARKDMGISETPEDLLKKASLDWENLSLKDLRYQMRKFSAWGSDKIIRYLEVEFQRKIAMSFSSFFLMLGTLPFALMVKQRRVGLTSIGLALIASFFYYLLFSLGFALSKVDFFLPGVGCWLPNIFFGVSGITGLLSIN